MPLHDTVAALNKMGGKSTPARTARFTARMSGMFSPQKRTDTQIPSQPASRRSSGRLQQRQTAPPVTASRRRNSLSLPEHENVEHTSRDGATKRKTALKKVRSNNKHSPLKKHGYDLELDENPKVNLHESPAKNTRSRNKNPLETLIQADLPIPKQWEEDVNPKSPRPTPRGRPAKNATRKRSANEEPESEQQRKSAKRARVEHARQASIQEDSNEQRGQESEREEAADGQDNAEPGPRTEQNTTDQNGTQTDTAVVDPPDGDQRTSRSNQERERSSTQAQREKEAENAAAQRAETDQEEAKELADRTERFVRDVGPVVRLADCEENWARAGGAASMIRARTTPGGEQSDRGKAVIRDIKRLNDAYRQRVKQIRKSPSSDLVPAAEHIDSLEARCKVLEPTTNSRTNSRIVGDIYMYIIPTMMVLLRSFLRARKGDISFNELELRELIRLLNMITGICKKALDWQPRPSRLDSGIKRWVKNDIAPNLKIIESRFEAEIAKYDRMVADEEAFRKLAQNQAFARKVFFEKVNRAKLERVVRLHNQGLHDKQRRGPQFEELDRVSPASYLMNQRDLNRQGSSPTSKSLSRSGLHREATVELPPPPAVELNEDEKTALLNGLQMYRDEDRYSQILNHPELGEILRKRDLDDLVMAAKSFSGMMASKMGLEAYRADSSLEWLRSTDTDMQDNVSVVF